MTKTKAKTTKAASKKTAAQKTVAQKKAAATKPTKKAPAAKSTAKKAAPAKKNAKTTAKAAVVVEAPKAKAQPVRADESKASPKPARAAEPKVATKPASKPVADFGAGLAAPREATKPAVAVEVPKPVARAEHAKPAVRAEGTKPAPAPKPEAPKQAPVLAVAEPADQGEVADFLRNCDHARVADFAQVRKLILEASASIEEGIKWNAPSFRTSEWFATFHLRDPNKVAIVFHLGAKKRETATRIPVGAPDGMVEWLAPDRCMVTVDDVKRRGKALQAFVRGWILHV